MESTEADIIAESVTVDAPVAPVTKEDISMSVVDSSVPVLPVTIPATGGYGGYTARGLEGKDAAFIAGLASEVGHRDNIRDTLENRFQIERLGRDLEVSQHRLELSNQKVLSEMSTLIKEENAKTRDLLEQREKEKQAAALAEAKMMLCILENKPTTVSSPISGTSLIH